jgi:hypothetical protein
MHASVGTGQVLKTHGTPRANHKILRARILSQRNEHVPIVLAFGLPREYFVKKVPLFCGNLRESGDQFVLHWVVAIKMIHATRHVFPLV